MSLPSTGVPKRASSDFESTVDREDLAGGFKVAIDTQSEIEEDSPYPEVRASVSNIDDTTMPALTFRTWFMGLGFVVVASGKPLCVSFVGAHPSCFAGLNGIFHYRQPAPVVLPLVLLLLSYPVGRFLAFALPIRVWRLPRWLGGGSFSLNPGPFNVKARIHLSLSHVLHLTCRSRTGTCSHVHHG